MSAELAVAIVVTAGTIVVTVLQMRKGARVGAAEGAREAAEASVWTMTQGLLSTLGSQVEELQKRTDALECEVTQVRADLEREREVARSLRLTVDRLERLIGRLRTAITALESQVVGLGQVPVTQAGGVDVDDSL